MNKHTNLPLLLLSLCIAVLAAGLFAYGAALATPTATHCVNPGDKIQDAIDAANSGDVIQVVTTTTFVENLVIDKSLTLEGGWAPDCSYQNDAWSSTIDGNAIDRVVTIRPSSGVIDVNITHMTFYNGNATGKGGGPSVDAATITPPSFTWPPAEGDQPLAPSASVPARTIDWEKRLAGLQAAGGFPGGHSAYKALVERFNTLLNPQDAPFAFPAGGRPAQLDEPAEPNASADCGGGVFVTGANLTIDNTSINLNVASTTGMGFGGGLCAVDLGGGSLNIVDNTQFLRNTASSGNIGVGGAIFIHGSDTASVVLSDFWLRTNIASSAMNGWGGGLAVFNTPSLTITKANILWNEAGRLYEYTSGLQSVGGGMYIDACPDANITFNDVFDNMADAGGAEGIAGGILVYESPRAQVGNNRIGRNTAHAQVGLRGPAGFGGGLVVGKSADVKVFNNTIYYNLASLYAQGFGGGFYAGETENLEVYDNKFEDNAAAYFPNGNQFGGGMIVVQSDGVHIHDNSFKRNMAGTWAVGDHLGLAPGGGGLAIDISQNIVIDNNNFEENTAMLSGFGNGGGLFIGGTSHDITVVNNTFHKNTGVRQEIGEDISYGEGAAIGIDYANNVNILRNTFTNNAGSLGRYNGSVIMSTHLLEGTQDYGGENIVIDSNFIANSGVDLLPEGSVGSIGIRAQFTKNFQIINNIIVNTQGPGVDLEYPTSNVSYYPNHAVINNTFVHNQGSAVALFGDWFQQESIQTVLVINNIFADHGIAISSESQNDLTVDHNLFYHNVTKLDGNLKETNSVNANPKFINPSTNNYQVPLTSPAVDAGLNRPRQTMAAAPAKSGIPLPLHDLKGARRPMGASWDIGAYELYQIFLPITIK